MLRKIRLLTILVIVLLALSSNLAARQSPIRAQEDDNNARRALLMNALEQVFNQGNVALVDAAFAESYISHPGDGTRDDFKNQILAYRAAMPDYHAEVKLAVIEGDYAATIIHATGTLENELVLPGEMSAGPTGEPFSLVLSTIMRFENSQVVESWNTIDTLTVLVQGGVLPAEFGREVALEDSLQDLEIGATGMEAEYTAAVETFLTGFSSATFDDTIPALVSDDFVHSDLSADYTVEDDSVMVAELEMAFPDISYPLSFTVAEGQWVAAVWMAEGTFSGEMALDAETTLPGNGNALSIQVTGYFHFNEAGKIDRLIEMYDQYSYLDQVGLIDMLMQ